MNKALVALDVNPAPGQYCQISTNVKVAGGGKRLHRKSVAYMREI
jgi:hypothetical protein